MPKLKPNQFYLGNHLITERPILFQTEMVQANLEDRKTQTRRKLKVRGCKPFYPDNNWELSGIKLWTKDYQPYGKPGDLLWVRETWLKFDQDHIGNYAYKANSDSETEEIRKDYIKSGRKYQWKPSIHMPKSAARLWLMVEDIRVERLQNISEEDAKAEGIKPVNLHDVNTWKRYDGYEIVTSNPVVSFWSLWASINGEESWEANPWVWVVQYRILSKTGRPSDETILEHYEKITGKEASSGS